MKYLAMLFLICTPAVHAADLMFLGGRAVLRSPAITFEATLTEPYKDNYSIQEALTYIGTSKWEDGVTPEPAKLQAAIRGIKTWRTGLFLGFGAAVANRVDNFNGSCLNFNEIGGVNLFNNHLVVQFEHTSNAGLKFPNIGRNLLLVGVKF